jgi:prepilin-type N-terminal cleavage/methylation domain-containing protein
VGTHHEVNSLERGDSLVEVVVAVAIIAIAVGALGGTLIAAEHRFGPDPIESALEETTTREMRIAVDVMKYQGASLPSTSLATTIPLPSGSPLPVVLSVTTATAADGSVTIVLSADDSNDANKSATLSQTIAAPAPLPGARLPAMSSGSAPQ